MFNAFNVLNGIVFFIGLNNSNGLKNLTDQRLMEVNFGVMINV